MTKENLSLIAVVMDRSGSMAGIRKVTIDGFNEFLRSQKELPGEAVMYYTQFDTIYEIVHNYVPLKEMPELNEGTYVPRGGTALLDAIGQTIKQVGADLAAKPENERPSNVIFVIQTDGEENSSKEYTNRKQIHDMIAEQRDVWNWHFLFLGASEDSIKEAQAFGINSGQTMHYAGGQSVNAFAAASASVGSTRLTHRSRDFTSKEREDASKQS